MLMCIYAHRGWDEIPPANRTRPEAESIVSKHTTDSMYDLMRSDNKPLTPTVKDSKKLPHMQESPSP